MGMNIQNLPLSSNNVLQSDSWEVDNGSQGMTSGSKTKFGAVTSTNFMNGRTQMNNQHLKMSMLRSVQQNMPNMPNVSYLSFFWPAKEVELGDAFG